MWAHAAQVEVGQIEFGSGDRRVADECPPADRDLIVAIGGDGTTLSAIRTAAPTGRPVLGVACGSLGLLTVVPAHQVGDALERFAHGDWSERTLPALDLKIEGEDPARAYNDIVVVRQAEGQVRISAHVDDTLFARFAGDGCIASTPVGSSAYTLAAGGPLLPLELNAFVLTTLPTHGGFRPPLVIGPDSTLTLDVACGYGGARLEIDGQIRELHETSLTISFEPHAATVVNFDGQRPFLMELRDRGIISDSPRIVAEDKRERDAKS
jgi:NAD+ kinase